MRNPDIVVRRLPHIALAAKNDGLVGGQLREDHFCAVEVELALAEWLYEVFGPHRLASALKLTDQHVQEILGQSG